MILCFRQPKGSQFNSESPSLSTPYFFCYFFCSPFNRKTPLLSKCFNFLLTNKTITLKTICMKKKLLKGCTLKKAKTSHGKSVTVTLKMFVINEGRYEPLLFLLIHIIRVGISFAFVQSKGLDFRLSAIKAV